MIRLAYNGDGERIGALVREAGFQVQDVDWSKIYPYWLVYEQDETILGCIQVAPARPFGRLEMLAIDSSVGDHTRGRIVRALNLQGAATLRESGSQFAMGLIPFHLKSYKKVLKKRGCVVIDQGNMMAARL